MKGEGDGRPSLDGRVALVTGGSRGIGRAVAASLAEAGAAVAVLSTTQTGGEAVAGSLRSRGFRSAAVTADVRRGEDLDAALNEVARALGPVDVLVNNAGVTLRRAAAEMDDGDFDRILSTNLSGAFYLARRVLPGMLARGWGRIVNVSSISGTLGTPQMTAYCASKWGLNGLTKALAAEARPNGVLVTAVLPGSVDTEMLRGSPFEARMTPEEVARVVRFLCAEAPLAMSGSLVEVFG